MIEQYTPHQKCLTNFKNQMMLTYQDPQQHGHISQVANFGNPPSTSWQRTVCIRRQITDFLLSGLRLAFLAVYRSLSAACGRLDIDV